MEHVRAKAMQTKRSRKKFDELCRKHALLKGDLLSSRRLGRDGITIFFSASIEDFDRNIPTMRTTDPARTTSWSCNGPTEFFDEMIRVFPNMEKSYRDLWDTIKVTRNGHDLGSLGEFRQCLELWEQEMAMWGCNGLGEKLDDKLTSPGL